VVWQEWSGRAGIQFVDVPQASRRALREWLRVNGQNESQAEAFAFVTVESQETPPQQESGSPLGSQSDSAVRLSRTKSEPGDEIAAAARLRLESGNRRGQTRYSCRIGAEVYRAGTTIPHRCNLTDLSGGGCYLEMTAPFHKGGSVEIVVRTTEQKLKLAGKVQSAHPGYGMGIAFDLKTDDERKGVQQLIDYVAATAETI
jgi:hypothetical protein